MIKRFESIGLHVCPDIVYFYEVGFKYLQWASYVIYYDYVMLSIYRNILDLRIGFNVDTNQ